MPSENETTAIIISKESIPVKIDKIEQSRSEITIAREKRYQQLAAYTDGMPFSKKRYIDGVRKSLEHHVLSGIDAGKKLIILKEMLEHGEFLEALADIDITPQSANNYMRIAFRFSNLDSSIAIDLGITKLYKMLQAPATEFQKFQETGEFLDLNKEELITLSARELEAHIKASNEKLKDDLQHERTRSDVLFHEKKELQENNKKLQHELLLARGGTKPADPLPSWWDHYLKTTAEIMALGTALAGDPPKSEEADRLQKLANRLHHELAYVWKYLSGNNGIDPVEAEDHKREKMAQLENDERFDWSKFDPNNSVMNE